MLVSCKCCFLFNFCHICRYMCVYHVCVCMCVCMYVYIYIHIHVCVHILP
jgi:hypothetical protein